MKKILLYFLVCLSLVGFVNATCDGDTDYNSWTIPTTSTSVCLWYNYNFDSACCIDKSCSTINSYKFCYYGNTGTCKKGEYLKCCPDSYPKYDAVTGWCWMSSWQCYQGFNNDCSKYGANAWCVGLKCQQPACQSNSGCGVGQICDISSSSAKNWKCVADPCYNVNCADTCDGKKLQSGGSCLGGICSYSSSTYVKGKCGADCGANSDCGNPNTCSDFNFITGNNCQDGTCTDVVNQIIGKCGVECTKAGDCGINGNENKFCNGLSIMQNYRTYSCDTYKCSSKVTAKFVSKCDWKCDNSSATCVVRTFEIYWRYDSKQNICSYIDLDPDVLPLANDYKTKEECIKNVIPTYYKFADNQCTQMFLNTWDAGPYDFKSLTECQTYIVQPKIVIPEKPAENATLSTVKEIALKKSYINMSAFNVPIISNETNWIIISVIIVVITIIVFVFLKKKR